MKLKTYMINHNNNRRADVGTVLGKYNVVLYKDGQQVRIVECHKHSESWAMDVAENWLNEVIKE